MVSEVLQRLLQEFCGKAGAAEAAAEKAATGVLQGPLQEKCRKACAAEDAAKRTATDVQQRPLQKTGCMAGAVKAAVAVASHVLPGPLQ